MLFNSTEFLIFFVVTLILGNLLKSKIQKLMLLVASYIFYMGWHPATISCDAYRSISWIEFWIDKSFCEYKINIYILILLISTLIDYFAARWMSLDKISQNKRKILPT